MNDIRFKLYLQPNTASTREIMQKLPPLSPKKQAVDILADFLRYMYACARTYIEESHAYGTALWTSVEDGIQFILTHLNGWEGIQQTQFREACVRAGLIPDTTAGRSRQYCIASTRHASLVRFYYCLFPIIVHVFFLLMQLPL
jgi:hypothetical protein